MASALAPFADIEAMVNRAVGSMLANATATFGGGQPFPVLLDREGDQPAGFAVDADVASAQFEGKNAPGLTRGSVLVIDGQSWTVESDAMPDASGWVRVDLHPSPAAGGDT